MPPTVLRVLGALSGDFFLGEYFTGGDACATKSSSVASVVRSRETLLADYYERADTLFITYLVGGAPCFQIIVVRPQQDAV